MALIFLFILFYFFRQYALWHYWWFWGCCSWHFDTYAPNQTKQNKDISREKLLSSLQEITQAHSNSNSNWKCVNLTQKGGGGDLNLKQLVECVQSRCKFKWTQNPERKRLKYCLLQKRNWNRCIQATVPWRQKKGFVESHLEVDQKWPLTWTWVQLSVAKLLGSIGSQCLKEASLWSDHVQGSMNRPIHRFLPSASVFTFPRSDSFLTLARSVWCFLQYAWASTHSAYVE